MLSETIRIRLKERFSAPLPEFHQRRIVFWRDEDGEFAEEISEFELPDVKVISLNGNNNFAVKKLLTADDLTSNYLVYDPLSYEKDHSNDWLLDIRLYSEEFHADRISLLMEELLVEPSTAMRKTMRVYSKFFENKERKAKLKRIGRTYQAPLQLHIDIMAVLCSLNGGSAQDVFIAVLSAGSDKESNLCLDSITRFGNIDAFWQMAQKYTGYVNSEKKSLNEFAAHILITALSQTMPASELRGLERFTSESNKAYCYQLVHEWQRDAGRQDLIEICRNVEKELRLTSRFDKIDIDVLLSSEVFPAIDESILKRLLDLVSERVVREEFILKVVENRRTSAWYDLTEDYVESLYYIAKMQEFYLEYADAFNIVEPARIWKLYTEVFYEMDSFYRHFHVHFNKSMKYPNYLLEDALKKCSDTVEGLYRGWYLKRLTDAWTSAAAGDLEALGYVSDIPQQRGFYKKHVKSNTDKGTRTFVVVSDALRYEVATELAETLSHTTKGEAILESAQAGFPGITKFGMAALLPGKELTVNDKMEVLVDGRPTNSTSYRNAVLNAENNNSIAITYDDLFRMKQQERRDLIVGKEVIYIYHDTIDAIGDKASTERKVFEACNTAIEELTSIVKVIVNDLSGVNIFVTADHGFLYTYLPLDESQKISRQTFQGDVYELGRRYALVSPDTTADYLLPIKTDRINGILMKGYAPQDTVRIKVQGGGANYVHGGISLQEMVVPVIVYKGKRADQKSYIEVQNTGLSLISESRKISNLMFSLDFLQKLPVSDKVQPCNYNLYFTDDVGMPVSDSHIVIADRTNHNASERVFRIRFTLKQMQYDHNKIYRLVITNDTDVPEEVEFNIDIAFADDFGFDL